MDDVGTTVAFVAGTGSLEVPFLIPNDTALLGLDLFGQGALLTPNGIELTNPDSKTIGH